MLSYIRDSNIYHEIAVMFSNLYMLATLDPDMSEMTESEGTQTQSLASGRTGTLVSMVPKTVYYLYDCGEDFQGCEYHFIGALFLFYLPRLFINRLINKRTIFTQSQN